LSPPALIGAQSFAPIYANHRHAAGVVTRGAGGLGWAGVGGAGMVTGGLRRLGSVARGVVLGTPPAQLRLACNLLQPPPLGTGMLLGWSPGGLGGRWAGQEWSGVGYGGSARWRGGVLGTPPAQLQLACNLLQPPPLGTGMLLGWSAGGVGGLGWPGEGGREGVGAARVFNNNPDRININRARVIRLARALSAWVGPPPPGCPLQASDWPATFCSRLPGASTSPQAGHWPAAGGGRGWEGAGCFI
jgi:hypothetical protein